MAVVDDPSEPPVPRERWLRVVRDGEKASPPPADAPPDPAPRHGTPAGGGPDPRTGAREPGSWARPTARRTWTGTATAPAHPPAVPAPRPPAPPPADPWVADRPAPEAEPGPWAHMVRAVGMVVAVVGAGTAGALLADRLVGTAGDGHPALYVLVALALPFWDALPARLGARVAVVAAVIAAVAAVWFGLALLADPVWWRAQVSFGLACLAVGTVHLLLAAALRGRRTVAG